MALTDDARAEIREAMRIIREDNFEKFARTRLTTLTTPKVSDPPKDPKEGDPPPPKDPPGDGDPSGDPPTGRKSAYWGQIFDDTEVK